MQLNGYISVPAGPFQDATMQLAATELTALTLRRFQQPGALQAAFTIEPELPSFEVRLSGENLVIAGPSSVEILYGVYDFAERYLGFCFFEPGRDLLAGTGPVELPAGVLIPARKIPFRVRGFIQEFPFNRDSVLVADWMAKNKLNLLNFWMKYYDDIDEATKQAFLLRGIEMHSGHHNFDYWIPSEKYYGPHPEFFAEYDGKRTKSEADANALLLGKQLCTTNPALRKEIVKNMLEYVQAHPELKILSLNPNDGFGWCECKECSKFYDKNKKGDLYSLSTHVYEASRIYHDMVLDVAQQLHAVRPDLTLSFGSYINYCRPSEEMRLTQGLSTHFAPYWRCINHNIDDPACPINSHYADDIRKWCREKDGGEFIVYEYYMGVNLYLSLPMIHHRRVFEEAKFYEQNGVDGVITQFHVPHWTVYGLNFKAMAHALRGEDEADFNRWILGALFGKDAAAAQSLYAQLESLLHSVGPCHVPYPYSLFNRTEAAQYQSLFASAQALLAMEPNSEFRRELVIWMEYLLRFKKTFDDYHNGIAGITEVDALLTWIHSHRGTRIFVHSKFDMYFEAWRQAIREHKPWLHFNLDWEDAYIRQHEQLLNGQ